MTTTNDRGVPPQTISGRFARPLAAQLELSEGRTVRMPVGESLDLLLTSRGLARADNLDRRDAEQ